MVEQALPHEGAAQEMRFRQPCPDAEKVVAQLEHGGEGTFAAETDHRLDLAVRQHVHNHDVALQRRFRKRGMERIECRHAPAVFLGEQPLQRRDVLDVDAVILAAKRRGVDDEQPIRNQSQW